ncbi:MAG: hypothetical protein QNI84_09345 [Henriciella sp.]|nr:hypothetical protein [Henriciella sp.]
MISFFRNLIRSNKIKLGACTAFVFAGACASQAMARKPAAVERAPASFFRVTADYTVIETGEEIKFDYVVGCGGIISNYSYTTPTVIYEAHPTLQVLPTSNGAAIGLKAPGILCDTRAFEEVPEIFQPFMMWFPDVEDLSFAWGYVTEVAYESPHAHVTFHGASVTPATETEWRDNRAQLLANYEQLGALPGPWGHSFSRSPSEEMARVYVLGKGFYIASKCQAYSRLPLSPELTEELFANAPEGTGRYWLLDRAVGGVDGRLKKPDVLFNGKRYIEYFRKGNGTIRRDGQGMITFRERSNALTETFPVLPIRQSMTARGIDLATPPEAYFRTVETGQDWNGFAACWSGGDPTVMPSLRRRYLTSPHYVAAGADPTRAEAYDPQARAKSHHLYFEDVLIGDNSDRQPGLPTILDRNGFVFFVVDHGSISLG